MLIHSPPSGPSQSTLQIAERESSLHTSESDISDSIGNFLLQEDYNSSKYLNPSPFISNDGCQSHRYSQSPSNPSHSADNMIYGNNNSTVYNTQYSTDETSISSHVSARSVMNAYPPISSAFAPQPPTFQNQLPQTPTFQSQPPPTFQSQLSLSSEQYKPEYFSAAVPMFPIHDDLPRPYLSLRGSHQSILTRGSHSSRESQLMSHHYFNSTDHVNQISSSSLQFRGVNTTAPPNQVSVGSTACLSSHAVESSFLGSLMSSTNQHLYSNVSTAASIRPAQSFSSSSNLRVRMQHSQSHLETVEECMGGESSVSQPPSELPTLESRALNSRPTPSRQMIIMNGVPPNHLINRPVRVYRTSSHAHRNKRTNPNFFKMSDAMVPSFSRLIKKTINPTRRLENGAVHSQVDEPSTDKNENENGNENKNGDGDLIRRLSDVPSISDLKKDGNVVSDLQNGAVIFPPSRNIIRYLPKSRNQKTVFCCFWVFFYFCLWWISSWSILQVLGIRFTISFWRLDKV